MGRVLHLLLLDLTSGHITDLMAGSAHELPRHDASANGYDVHPLGKRIAFTHDAAAVPRMGNPLSLAQIDLQVRRSAKICASASKAISTVMSWARP